MKIFFPREKLDECGVRSEVPMRNSNGNNIRNYTEPYKEQINSTKNNRQNCRGRTNWSTEKIGIAV